MAGDGDFAKYEMVCPIYDRHGFSVDLGVTVTSDDDRTILNDTRPTRFYWTTRC